MANMPDPPGGKLTCPSGYYGITSQDLSGRINAECVPITGTPDYENIGRTVIGHITGQKLPPRHRFTSRERQILKDGQFQSFDRKYYFEKVDADTLPPPAATSAI